MEHRLGPVHFDGIRPSRFRSLWEMILYDAASFYFATTSLAMTRMGIDYSIQNKVYRGQALVNPLDLGHIIDGLMAVKHSLPAGCDLVLMSIDGLLDQIDCPKPQISADKLSDSLRTIEGRLRDSLRLCAFLSLTPNEATLYNEKEPQFGCLVEDVFPAASEDISESAKCLALGRTTATVFHLMRAMECSVQVLSQKLGIRNTEREWGKLLSDIGNIIKEMPLGSVRDKWSEVHTHLYHVKQAWRNNTMHPKQTYTDVEAEAIFSAVRVFMNGLAALVSG
jgi:hypothetical protein